MPHGNITLSGLLIRTFTHHVLRVLVLAQPQEARMPQPAVARPLGEADLRDEPRLDPGRAAQARRIGERGVLAPKRRKPGGEVPQDLAREAGSHLAGVAQVPVLPVADE